MKRKSPGMVKQLAARVLIGVAGAFVCSLTLSAQAKPAAEPPPGDEFFIISSIDAAKNQLVVKRPTEVTDVMHVDKATRYLDEKGKPIGLADLRAGDTVFIASKPGAGASVAVQIRKGPMTLIELRRRYLR